MCEAFAWNQADFDGSPSSPGISQATSNLVSVSLAWPKAPPSVLNGTPLDRGCSSFFEARETQPKLGRRQHPVSVAAAGRWGAARVGGDLVQSHLRRRVGGRGLLLWGPLLLEGHRSPSESAPDPIAPTLTSHRSRD